MARGRETAFSEPIGEVDLMDGERALVPH